jgi:hypothetical protein
MIKSGEHCNQLAETKKVIRFKIEEARICETFLCIIIKGVCGYADSYKNKIWQNYVSVTAASCVKVFLWF